MSLPKRKILSLPKRPTATEATPAKTEVIKKPVPNPRSSQSNSKQEVARQAKQKQKEARIASTPRITMTEAELRKILTDRLTHVISIIEVSTNDELTARQIRNNFRMDIVYCPENPILAYDFNGVYSGIAPLLAKRKYSKMFRKIKQLYIEYNEKHALGMREV